MFYLLFTCMFTCLFTRVLPACFTCMFYLYVFCLGSVVMNNMRNIGCGKFLSTILNWIVENYRPDPFHFGFSGGFGIWIWTELDDLHDLMETSGGSEGGGAPNYGPKFSQFYAVFWKIWQICMLAPLPGGLASRPTRNPGSVPGNCPIFWAYAERAIFNYII